MKRKLEKSFEIKRKDWRGVKTIFNDLEKNYKIRIRKILDLEKGWDLPSSGIYKAETIKISLLYLSKIIQSLKKEFNKKLPYPMIFPGGSGGIELEWSEQNFVLQVSIPKNTKEFTGIYGVNKMDKDDEILIDCRLFEVSENLIVWLNRMLRGD